MRPARLPDVLVAVIAVGGASVAVLVDQDAGAPELLFLTVLFGCLLTVARLAWRSARRALDEGRRARHLEGLEAADVASRAVAAERARLAADIEVVVRAAATAMGRAADEAVRLWDGDPRPALHRIQQQGDRAGLELRRLLGILREAGTAAADRPVPSPSPRIRRGDVALAAAVTVLAVAETVAYRGEPGGPSLGPLSAVLTASAAAPVAWRRVAPDAGALACGAAFAAGIAVAPLSSGFWLIAGPGVLTWAAVSTQGTRGALAAALLIGAAALEGVVDDPDNALMRVLVLLAAAAGGAAVWVGDRRGRAARARADQRQADIDTAAVAAVRAERLAVARELHDLVSSAVGVMVMQAGAALATRDADPDRARRALEVVRRTAAETLTELDGLVEVMDHGVLGGPPVAPLDHDRVELDALVERMRGAGLDVRLVVGGTLTGEPAAVVYRVVQEALTNVVRHAPGADVEVRVESRAEGVSVDVLDDGPGPVGTRPAGYGLIGIAERVHRLGGEFSAGPGPGGRGFRVHADMPAMAASGT